MLLQGSFISGAVFPNPFLSKSIQSPKPFVIRRGNSPFQPQEPTKRLDVRSFARKKQDKTKLRGSGPAKLEGYAELLKETKRKTRRRVREYMDDIFYRLKNPHKNYPDNFTVEELQMIGLGYDRMVRFMDKDDPNLLHPHDWYKYGDFGPYSWRGIVLGRPVRPRMSDEYVTMIGEVRDHEEWEKIERFDMVQDFGTQMNKMDKKNGGLRYYWVFVRHPKWNISDLPWQQWTLVCEVVLEAGKQRLDKWNLMGRLGNNSRSNITQCAAWYRPDIIYVKKPVYQCRFEPQDEFFQGLSPLLNPETEGNFPCELEDEDGNVQLVTYYGGLCKLVKVNQKAFVDDVVKGYEKLSDEKKSQCLQFLLGNHPCHLLHPYSKEWKAKLEEMEMGCDAPDDDDDHLSSPGKEDANEVVDWIEDENGEEEDVVLDMDENMEDDVVLDMDESMEDDELGFMDEEEHREEEFKKALSSSEEMENLVKRSIESNNKVYKEQMKKMGIEEEEEEEAAEEEEDKEEEEEEAEEEEAEEEEESELGFRGKSAKLSREEWRRLGYGRYRKRVKRSRIPPGLFLRAAVRPYTYKNLVKEIALTRHAFLDGEIGGNPKN